MNTAGWDWHYLGALAALVSIYSGVILWAVRVIVKRGNDDTRARLDELLEKDKTNERDIDQVREALAAHRIEVATTYIRREDAVVYFSRFEQKIDAIWEFLHKRFARGSASD